MRVTLRVALLAFSVPLSVAVSVAVSAAGEAPGAPGTATAQPYALPVPAPLPANPQKPPLLRMPQVQDNRPPPSLPQLQRPLQDDRRPLQRDDPGNERARE